MRVRVRAVLVAVVILFSTAVLWPAKGSAQSIDVGLSAATACRGSEGSVCGGGSAGLWGGSIGLVLAERVEIGIWTARMGGEDRFVRFGLPPDEVEIATADRSRALLMGQVIYHFMPGERIRWLAGGGFGRRFDAWTTTCRPQPCGDLWPLRVDGGRAMTGGWNLAGIAGFSVRATDRIRFRTGTRLHNFAAEEASTVELFVEAAYRFLR